MARTPRLNTDDLDHTTQSLTEYRKLKASAVTVRYSITN